MLNRRHLRIKLFQILYAYYRDTDKDLKAVEKELFKSIEKSYEMYIYYLTLFDEVLSYAQYKIDEGKQKRLATFEDLNPNLRFVNNKLLNQLSTNKSIQENAENFKVSWMTQEEQIKKMFNYIKAQEWFKVYMSSREETTYKEDSDLVVKMFKKIICNYEPFHHFFEEESIYWMDDIDLVCSMVIKTLKTFNEESDEHEEILPLFRDADDEKKFLTTLFKKTISNDKWATKIIDERTKNWELDRIAVSDIILLKMALTEAKEFSTIPFKVTLNEYIELAKYYSTPKSNVFINGILDKVFEELRLDGSIVKEGKGLLE